MIFSYSLSLPLESFHLLNITDASTLAGLYVLGSFSKLTTESKMVLKKKNIEKLTFWTKFENPENLDRYSKQNRLSGKLDVSDKSEYLGVGTKFDNPDKNRKADKLDNLE